MKTAGWSPILPITLYTVARHKLEPCAHVQTIGVPPGSAAVMRHTAAGVAAIPVN